jgi:hypothetical protein
MHPLISHNTYRFDRQEHRKRLGNLVIQPRCLYLLNEDVVCFASNGNLFSYGFASDTDGNSGAREKDVA